MIKTKRGMVDVNGSTTELIADFVCITRCLYEEVLLDDMPEDKAKETIYHALETGINHLEDNKPEIDCELSEQLEDLLEGLEALVEHLEKRTKGKE